LLIYLAFCVPLAFSLRSLRRHYEVVFIVRGSRSLRALVSGRLPPLVPVAVDRAGISLRSWGPNPRTIANISHSRIGKADIGAVRWYRDTMVPALQLTVDDNSINLACARSAWTSVFPSGVKAVAHVVADIRGVLK
jgi:hypothetical protein